MIRRNMLSAVLGLTAVSVVAGAVVPAHASDRERRFFKTVEGEWSGPGQVVAGKYKGTKFVCNFTGETPDGKVGMSLDGGCRVGLFTQHMSARVEKAGGRGYRGKFLDGAKGKGLDVVSGRIGADKVVFALNRNALDGAMLAHLSDANTMNITVSVKVEGQMVPVIGVSLKRVDAQPVGAIASK